MKFGPDTFIRIPTTFAGEGAAPHALPIILGDGHTELDLGQQTGTRSEALPQRIRYHEHRY